jgi:hypothetical protein
MTHEFFEAITDPNLNTWFDPKEGPNKGNEIGDNCNQQPATVILNIVNGNNYVVQQQWDNSTSTCVSSMLSPGSLLDCSSPENSFIVSDPRNNPMTVSQGGTNVDIFVMAGPWVGADFGNNATGNVFATTLPLGSTYSTSPGYRQDPPHCEGIMELFVTVPLSARPGSYWAGVGARDAISGVTAKYYLPIQIKACAPVTSCPVNAGLCGPISNNCGGTVDCGACGAGLSCSNSHCCPPDDVYDTALNACRPKSCPPGTVFCADLGDCTTPKQCRSPPPTCGGRPC